jgi:hypothetical protein
MAKEFLTIWVAREWIDRPEVVQAMLAGHTIQAIDWETDLILHPKAWRWEEGLFPHLDITIKEAKHVKYGDARKQARLEAKARKNAGGVKRPKRPKSSESHSDSGKPES